jgi:integrase/recombinase XerD
MYLHEAAAYFLNACELEKNLTPRTLIAYASDLHQFQTFMSASRTVEPEFVSSPLLHSFVSELKVGKHLSDSSIRRKVAVVRRFFTFLEQRDIIQSNPFRKANFSFRQRVAIPRVLNRQEIMAILSVLKQPLTESLPWGEVSDNVSIQKFVAVRDNALLELLFYTGARVGEIVGLNLSDCNIEGGYVRLDGKGRRDRIVHLGCAAITGAISL